MKKTNAKMRKTLTIFIMIFFSIMVSGFLYASSVIDDPIEISFQDKNLFDSVKVYFETENMKYSANEEILVITASESEVNLVEELDLRGREGSKVSNAIGLEKFGNLKKVNLSNNNIVDITPIAELEHLISIDLSSNSNVKIYDTNKKICYLPNQNNLQELYISSTNSSDLSFANKLSSLKVLKASNNRISTLSELKGLCNLEVLDVSNNSITTIDDILEARYRTTLKELNIASTSITDLLHSDYEDDVFELGIFNLVNIESLNVEYNNLSVEPIYTMYTNEDDEDIPWLAKLKLLNINYTNKDGLFDVDLGGLSQLTNLTNLYAKGNQIDYISSNITKLSNLEYISLAENNIEDISEFICYDSDGYVESTLAAKKIDLANNYIQDVSVLGSLGHDITYLDLSSNIVFYIDPIDFGRFSFSDGLDLTRQGRDKYDDEGNEEYVWYMSVKDKASKLNQYIFLPTLFQNSKKSGSIVYEENINFSMENISLNPDSKYHVPGYYNVVIEPLSDEELDEESDENVKEKVLSITLHGGCADESQLHFRIEDNYDSIDSILFKDENLAKAIEEDLIPKANAQELYVKNELDLLNITYSLISETETLRLENKNITYLNGLSSFDNLANLYISNNNISTLDELKYCENIKELYVSNNNNIGNNNSAIEKMKYLVKLDLSTTGMTNINSLQKLISEWNKEEEYPLTYLNISNNMLGNIENVGVINSLEELHIANIRINDILLSEVESLNKLKTLNISGNEIQDINVLQGLTRLKNLNMSNNKIKNIIPISNISLDSLDFSNNKVKDVSSLKKSYSSLKMDTNEISDISSLDGKIIPTFSVTNQNIIHVIDTIEYEEITIPLPSIFQYSKNSTSKVYTAKSFIMANCNLSSDGNSVIINLKELGNNIATVKINGGNAHLTTFSIAAPLKGTMEYNIAEKTNQDVTAKIVFNRGNVTITNNDGKSEYKFTQNGEFTFEYRDEYGFEGTTTVVVNWIDKDATKCIVSKQVVDKNVVVTIKADEELKSLEGWNLSEDKRSITKTFSADTKATLQISDLAGNITDISIDVKIDTIAPQIVGVTNNQKYKQSVTPVIKDENLKEVRLTKNGVKVENYKSGDVIKDSGLYVLTAIDTFENTTTISFEIEALLDIITSNSFEVKEDNLLVTGVQPKTTIESFKKNIKSEMEYQIVDKDGNIVSEKSSIATGYQIKMNNDKKYTIIISGDCNGDGQADIKDILAINKHRLNKGELTESYLLAGDVNGDGKADIKDILQINKYRLGRIDSL